MSSIARLAAMLEATKPMQPITIHVGQIVTSFSNHVEIPKDKLVSIDGDALEKSDVVISITVQCGEPTKYVLRGEWNAIESFLSTHYNRTEYSRFMEVMDINQFTRAKA